MEMSKRKHLNTNMKTCVPTWIFCIKDNSVECYCSIGNKSVNAIKKMHYCFISILESFNSLDQF